MLKKIALWWWRWAWRIHVLILVGIFGAWFAPSVSPHHTLIFFFLGLGFYPLICCNVIFCLIWAWRKEKKYFLTGFIILLISLLPLQNLINIKFFNPKNKNNQPTLKILSYNTGGISKPKNSQVISFFDNTDADVMCFQEWTQMQEFNYFYKQGWAFLSKYPYIGQDKDISSKVLSKYPIINQGALKIKYSDGGIDGSIFADLNINGKIIRVYSIHLLSYSVTNTVDILSQSSIERLTNSDKEIKSVLRRLKNMEPRRLQQARELAEHIKNSPYPVIVAGDFNEVPQSYIYHLLRGELNDAFRRGGHGFGFTFNGNIPALKIDYTFYSPSMTILKHEIDKKADFSDHFPLISILAF